MIDFRSDFGQHMMLFLLTLAVICIGTGIGAPKEVLEPLAQGLGMALPAMLGAHGIASGLRAWRGDGSKDEGKEAKEGGDSK